MQNVTRYMVCKWHVDPRYTADDALAIYKSEKIAQRVANGWNDRGLLGGNMVVRPYPVLASVEG